MLGNRFGVELVVESQFQYLTVLIVVDSADRPCDQVLLALLLQFMGQTVGSILVTGLLPGGERPRIRADLALRIEALVEAAGGALVVTQLLAPKVAAGEPHGLRKRGVERLDLVLAEVGPKCLNAQERLADRASLVELGNALAPGAEAERFDGLLDAVEVVDDEFVPRLGGGGQVAGRHGDVIPAQEMSIGVEGQVSYGVASRLSF